MYKLVYIYMVYYFDVMLNLIYNSLTKQETDIEVEFALDLLKYEKYILIKFKMYDEKDFVFHICSHEFY